MFNALVHNIGRDRVQRKPIERMFPAIKIGKSCPEVMKCLECNHWITSEDMQTVNQCGACHERNAKKEKEKCSSEVRKESTGPKSELESGPISSTTRTTDMKSSGSLPKESEREFKAGYICEVYEEEGIWEPCKIIKVHDSGRNVVVNLLNRDLGFTAPLCALRHAVKKEELEPPTSEWDELECNLSGSRVWVDKEKTFKITTDGKHWRTLFGKNFPSWLALKAHLEKQ